jgi:hypothetical protein
MRQILIEKYIKPNEIKATNDGTFTERWFNKHGEYHSFMGHPAGVWYDRCGIVEIQFWCKKDLYHRDKGLPATIMYYNSKPNLRYYKDGEEIKKINS